MVDTGHVNFDFKTTKVDPYSYMVTGDCVIKFDQHVNANFNEEVQKAINEGIDRMINANQSDFVLDADVIRQALEYAHSPNRQPRQKTYQVGDTKYDHEDDIPRVDIHKWAKDVGLEISEDGKTITCYKAVHKIRDGEYVPVMYASSGTVYKTGEYVFADELDRSQFEECSNGLHAGNMECAFEYIGHSGDDVIIELKVDISDPNNYVIPYVSDSYQSIYWNTVLHPSRNKFRFLKAYVVREVPVKKVFYDKSTGKMWDI